MCNMWNSIEAKTHWIYTIYCKMFSSRFQCLMTLKNRTEITPLNESAEKKAMNSILNSMYSLTPTNYLSEHGWICTGFDFSLTPLLCKIRKKGKNIECANEHKKLHSIHLMCLYSVFLCVCREVVWNWKYKWKRSVSHENNINHSLRHASLPYLSFQYESLHSNELKIENVGVKSNQIFFDILTTSVRVSYCITNSALSSCKQLYWEWDCSLMDVKAFKIL